MAVVYDDLPNKIQHIFNSCDSGEQEILLQILNELSCTGESQTYENIWLADYKEIPVDIYTFIHDDMYLGKTNNNGQRVYPFWKSTMQEIFDAGNQYDEIVFTGATRIGKTSTAITCVAYMLYRLMCLRDPQQYYNKKEISKFSILFFNITKDLAQGVAYREFQDTLKESPWFNDHGKFTKSDRNFYYVPEGGKIVIDYGSDAAHALGMQVFAAVADETNFRRAGIIDINKAKSRMQDLYNTVSARIKGTFRKHGEVHGKLFAVSSKNTDNDFLSDYIQRQQSSGAGDHMYIVDKPQWEVLPASMFHEEKFMIAVGDRYHKGFVVPDNQTDIDSIQDLTAQGYQILTPPIDMRPEFIADFDIALRDLAGISVPGALSFITQEIIDQCIDTTRRNPFYNEILSIGTRDSLTIEEFFHIDAVPQQLRRLPLYIHLDLSLTTDDTGIGCVCISGRKDINSKDGKVVSLPVLSHVFSVSLRAVQGDKIPYEKIFQFILWLRKQGFHIKFVTRDQFQSEYIGQLLEAQNIPSPKISLDRTPDGYAALRSVLQEQRISLLDCKQLQDELIHLQRDSVTGKVDHPMGGRKDCSDGLAGAVWQAILDSPGVTVPIKSIANTITSVNTSRYGNSAAYQDVGAALANLYKKKR